MSLGKKISVGALLLGCCIATGSYVAISWSVFPQFEAFETDAAHEAMERLENVALTELRGFSIMNGEYASWNDTYSFVLGHHDAYIKENLSTAYWKNLGVDLVMIYDANGRPVWRSFTSPEYGDAGKFNEQLERPIGPGHPLLEHGTLDDSVSGVLRTAGGPMMVASDAILTTYGEGPGVGSFVIARYIDDSMIGDFADRSSSNARFIEFDVAKAEVLTPAQVTTLVAAEDKRIVERTIDEVVSYRLVRDVLGEPAGVLEVRMSHMITTIGRDAINTAIVLIVGITGVFVVFLVILIRRLVVAPVRGLTAHMEHIRETGDLEPNSLQAKSDEIGMLAREFDELITDLHLAQSELKATRDVAVEASRAKSEFLARMSHEIRTPMNGVLGMTELLKNTPMNIEQQRFADTIYHSAENLLDIINDILDFSKIEAGKLQLDVHELHLGTLIEEILETLAPQAQQKGLELISDVDAALPASLKGDSVRLRQVLMNLIANAIKFTNSGEVVARAIVVHDDDATAAVRVEIVDTGIGIRADKRHAIFESFAQEDGSTTRLYGGTGLGLAICKQLVELMGGELTVESKPGKGSTFSFTLQMQRGVAAASAALDSTERVAGARILVVDDNATNREILEQQLSGWRARCDSAASAADALPLMRDSLRAADSYNLVVLDMHMPLVDGIELARKIRADERFDDVKLLLLSSVAMPASEDTLHELRIAGQLSKPIRQSHLYDCLSAALNGQSLHASHNGQQAGGSRNLRGRVLLAEDNPVNQAVATGMLSSMGISVDVVGDGAAAVSAVANGAFDLILMDCQMPVMDGLTATQQIRRTEKAAHRARQPIVALTANAMAGDRERCLEAGMDEYLGKPFTQDQLHAVLSLYLERSSKKPQESCTVTSRAESAPPPEPTAPVETTTTATLDLGVLAVLQDLQQPGSPSLVDKVIGIYLDSAPPLCARLLGALDDGDSRDVSASAHALKSSSTNVGGTRLADICKRLEHLARDNDLAAAGKLRNELETEFARVMDALHTRLAA